MVAGVVKEQRPHERSVCADGFGGLLGEVVGEPLALFCEAAEHRDDPFVAGRLGDVPGGAVAQRGLVMASRASTKSSSTPSRPTSSSGSTPQLAWNGLGMQLLQQLELEFLRGSGPC